MSEEELDTAFESFSKRCKLTPDSIKGFLKMTAIIDKDTEITEADVDAAIAKSSTDKGGLDFSEIKKCIKLLSQDKKVESKELRTKFATGLEKCGTPSINIIFDTGKDKKDE